MKKSISILPKSQKRNITASYSRIEGLSEEKIALALEFGVISKKEYEVVMNLKAHTASLLPPRKLIRTLDSLCKKGFLSTNSCTMPIST